MQVKYKELGSLSFFELETLHKKSLIGTPTKGDECELLHKRQRKSPHEKKSKVVSLKMNPIEDEVHEKCFDNYFRTFFFFVVMVWTNSQPKIGCAGIKSKNIAINCSVEIIGVGKLIPAIWIT